MSTPRIPARIEQLYETEPEWLIADPVILRGEFAAVKFGKTTKIKIGDGSKKFSELSYMVFETGALKDGINPSTPAVTPTDPISFIAETGVYPNYGGVEVTGAAGYIVWNGTEWKAVNVNIESIVSQWTPYYTDESYLDKIIRKLADYKGGTGTKPTDDIGKYVLPNGQLTDDRDLAMNYKGSGNNITVAPVFSNNIFDL